MEQEKNGEGFWRGTQRICSRAGEAQALECESEGRARRLENGCLERQVVVVSGR